jgi:hypothetical protein
VFTARYGLSPYVVRTSFVFQGLKLNLVVHVKLKGLSKHNVIKN